MKNFTDHKDVADLLRDAKTLLDNRSECTILHEAVAEGKIIKNKRSFIKFNCIYQEKKTAFPILWLLKFKLRKIFFFCNYDYCSMDTIKHPHIVDWNTMNLLNLISIETIISVCKLFIVLFRKC